MTRLPTVSDFALTAAARSPSCTYTRAGVGRLWVKTMNAIAALLATLIAGPPAMAANSPPPLHQTVTCGPNPRYYDDGRSCVGDNAIAYADEGGREPPFRNPSVRVHVGDQGQLGSASALAALTYYFIVRPNPVRPGPFPGTLVPVDADFTLTQQTPGAYLGADAFASVAVSGPQGLLGGGYKSICTLGCAGSGGDAIERSGSLNFEVFANTTYSVTILASASVSSSVIPTFAEATADPFFYIHPGFANAADYDFVFSDGIQNIAPGLTSVPETETWAMMILGLATIGGAARRSRQPRLLA